MNSMTGWLLLFGTTRSLLELGRETKIRQWYFSLSCGRVGHCPVFKFILTPYYISTSLQELILLPPVTYTTLYLPSFLSLIVYISKIFAIINIYRYTLPYQPIYDYTPFHYHTMQEFLHFFRL